MASPKAKVVVAVLALGGIVVSLMQTLIIPLIPQLTISVGSASVPSQGGFRLILAIGSVAALVALAIAAFLPARRPVYSAPHEPDLALR